MISTEIRELATAMELFDGRPGAAGEAVARQTCQVMMKTPGGEETQLCSADAVGSLVRSQAGRIMSGHSSSNREAVAGIGAVLRTCAQTAAEGSMPDDAGNGPHPSTLEQEDRVPEA